MCRRALPRRRYRWLTVPPAPREWLLREPARVRGLWPGRGGVRAQQLQPRYPVLNPIKEQPRIPELLPHVAQLGTERAGLFPGAAFLQRLVWLEISGGKRPTAVDAEGVADVVFPPALGAFYSGWSVLAGHQSQALEGPGAEEFPLAVAAAGVVVHLHAYLDAVGGLEHIEALVRAAHEFSGRTLGQSKVHFSS